MTSNDSPTTPPKPRHWKRYLIVGISFVFSLLLGSVLLALLIPQLLPPQQKVAEESPAIRTLDHRLTAIERRLETLADDVAKRPTVVPVASSKLWWIAETERYLVEAGERLENGSAVTAALPALKSAKQTLADVDLAAADAVKKALDKEIQLLSEYRNESVAQALTAIDELLEQFENNAATGPGNGGSDTAAKPASDTNLWTQLTDAVTDRFQHLVTTTNKSDTESARMIQGLVMRSLLLARTAVISNDGVSYRYAIANAIQAFEQRNEIDGVVYDELQTLHALDIVDAPPRIGKALSEIRALASEMTRKTTP